MNQMKADDLFYTKKSVYDKLDEEMKNLVNLLQIDEDDTAGFIPCGWEVLNVLIKESDLKFGNWKKTRTVLV